MLAEEQGNLELRSGLLLEGSVSPYLEMGAYEALWARRGMTFKRMAELFRAHPEALPSDLVPEREARERAAWASEQFEHAGVSRWGIRVHRAGEYPVKLRDARHPVELLYFAGAWELVESPCVAVVGTRDPSGEGRVRARRLVGNLVDDGWTIVSGLARGIDTEAHRAALDMSARTIAVIGTPLSESYPPENRDLQNQLAKEQLVISQVPVYRYSLGHPRINRVFFPERNVTMSALTAATIIVEASDTSGTLTQARAALHQGRKLFILESCFQNEKLRWPREFESRGAVRVKEYDDVRAALPAPPHPS